MTTMATQTRPTSTAPDASAFAQHNGEGPEFLRKIRKRAFEEFEATGFPTTRSEAFRYTNLKPIAETAFAPAPVVDSISQSPADFDELDDAYRMVFINARFSAEHSSIADLPDGVTVASLAEAMTNSEQVQTHLAQHADVELTPFTAWNTAFIDDGAFIHVAKDVTIKKPISLIFVTATNGSEASIVTHPRVLIIAEQSANVTVVETFVSDNGGQYLTNTVTEIVSADNAIVDHYKVQRDSEEAWHFGTLSVQQTRNCDVHSQTINLGGAVARHEMNTNLDGCDGHCNLRGLYVLRDKQHVDNHLRVNHNEPHCDSREYFKGILADRATAVFTGRIYVKKDAQKTDAKQTSQSLLLSDRAKVTTKPQLEIYADDVKCTHGATIGELNQDAMFYLRARGLNEIAARTMLIYAFIGEVLDEIRIPPLRDAMLRRLFERLPDTGGLDLADA